MQRRKGKLTECWAETDEKENMQEWMLNLVVWIRNKKHSLTQQREQSVSYVWGATQTWES